MSKSDLYSLAAYQFDLPPELIAQYPCTPRDSSRLMIVERSSGQITEIIFRELADFLNTHDHLIFNNTKVIPARLMGKRANGGEAEIFLLRRYGAIADAWEVMARPGKKIRPGSMIYFSDQLSCEILETLTDGNKIVRFIHEGNFENILEKHGKMPLPHYIQRSDTNDDVNSDSERYQTIYAANSGAVAAPTAGLHFSQDLLDRLQKKEVYQTFVTLHVGLGTFRPVQVEDIRSHAMHSERVVITPEAAHQLNNRSLNHRQICIGTTCCRALESISTIDGRISPGEYDTNIFIYPGYSFKYVQSLLTNFHLPGSSLLMLVSAFAGYELTREVYAKAIERRFRFFSYGDAMLIL